MTFSPKVWGDVLRRLQNEIPDFAFDAWIAPLAVKVAVEAAVEKAAHDSDPSGATAEKYRIILGCPTSFHRERIQSNYKSLIAQCWQGALAELTGEANEKPAIELLGMQEFARTKGTRIELQRLARQQGSARASIQQASIAKV